MSFFFLFYCRFFLVDVGFFFIFRKFRSSEAGILFWDLTWIRGFFDGVKPPKGQDCGRSTFSYVYDRDRR